MWVSWRDNPICLREHRDVIFFEEYLARRGAFVKQHLIDCEAQSQQQLVAPQIIYCAVILSFPNVFGRMVSSLEDGVTGFR